MVLRKEQLLLGLTRISLGCIFLWAFLDKLFGLRFSTLPEKAWILGGSPTLGFLSKGTHGPFVTFYQSLAGNPSVDAVFMIGLLLIGISLISGMGIKIAGYSGALLMALMYTAAIPPTTNPIIDDHIIYGLLLLAFAQIKVGQWLGFGKQWSKTNIVKQHPILE